MKLEVGNIVKFDGWDHLCFVVKVTEITVTSYVIKPGRPSNFDISSLTAWNDSLNRFPHKFLDRM